MKAQRKRRLLLSLVLVVAVGGAVGLALTALEKNINLFFSPSQVLDGEAPAAGTFRLGGMVVTNSVTRNSNDLTVRFVLTDRQSEVAVEYTGILPDLFREGQGIVALGAMRGDTSGVFVAQQVLAKHDENYMPPEVYSALNAAQNYDNDKGKNKDDDEDDNHEITEFGNRYGTDN